MVAALLIRAAQGSPHLTPYIGASLPKHTISSEMLDAPSLCFCKVRCFVKETCNAVTISMERPGTTDCFFSETKQGEEVLESTTAAISFLKPSKSQHKFLCYRYSHTAYFSEICHLRCTLSGPAEPSPVNVSTSTSNTEAGSTSTDSTQGSKTPIPTSTGNISTTSGSTAQSHSVSTTTTTTISSITTTSNTCDTPFSLIQNVGCLLIVRNDTSWYAAEDYCTARGLQLFVAESTIVFDKLAQYLEANEEGTPNTN
ncbi:hypothetical protein SK128_005862 [Halocaridina rubra]|uniref:Uncharacterized protein n=1 Tax=Halocaridina rubra TaxID=373956 RepID=A0AAN8XP89_HALRR